MDLIVFIFGLCIGSFLNVCIYRLPLNQSIIKPSSFCPKCNTPLKWYHNIPVLSYFILRGKCAYCGERISIRYLAVEIITGALLLINYRIFSLSFDFFYYSLFVCLLIIVIFVDLKHMIIPDEISIGGVIAGFLMSFFSSNITFKESLIGILVGGGILYAIIWIYYIFTKKEGMGGGDVKLLAMIGAFLGYRSIFFVIFSASIIGTIIAVPFMILKGKGRDFAIPFGPFLSIGALIYLYFGDEIIKLFLYNFQ